MSTVVGFFQWRRGLRGDLYPSKYLKENRDWLRALPNSFDRERHFGNLINEVPLDLDQWKLSLNELAQHYPCPEAAQSSPHRAPPVNLTSTELTREQKRQHLIAGYRLEGEVLERELDKLYPEK